MIKQPLSCYLKVSELSEDIEVGISHVTAFNKLSGQRPKYIKRKYDHGTHEMYLYKEKTLVTCKMHKKRNGNGKQERGRLQRGR